MSDLLDFIGIHPALTVILLFVFMSGLAAIAEGFGPKPPTPPRD